MHSAKNKRKDLIFLWVKLPVAPVILLPYLTDRHLHFITGLNMKYSVCLKKIMHKEINWILIWDDIQFIRLMYIAGHLRHRLFEMFNSRNLICITGFLKTWTR